MSARWLERFAADLWEEGAEAKEERDAQARYGCDEHELDDTDVWLAQRWALLEAVETAIMHEQRVRQVVDAVSTYNRVARILASMPLAAEVMPVFVGGVLNDPNSPTAGVLARVQLAFTASPELEHDPRVKEALGA